MIEKPVRMAGDTVLAKGLYETAGGEMKKTAFTKGGVGGNKMKAGNAGTFLKMLNPGDGQYGFQRLSNGDVDKLIKYYQDKKHLMKGLKRDEAKKVLWDKVYKGDKKDLYGEDLIKSGALEVPGPLKGLSVGKIREKLQKHKMYSYKFKVSYESSYKNAIKVLQQSLKLSATGRYTEDVARAVYEKIKGEIPKKKGYLASEDDPDRLFKSGFLEYVFCVDQAIWALCGVEEKWLKDDGAKVWNTDVFDQDDMDQLCKQRLLELNRDNVTSFKIPSSEEIAFQDMNRIRTVGLGGQTIALYGSPETQIHILYYNAELQARAILDQLLADLIDEYFNFLENRYENKLNYEETVYSVISFLRNLVASVPDIFIDGINIGKILSEYKDFITPQTWYVPAIAVVSYLAHDAPDIKGMLNIPDLPTDEVDKARRNLSYVQNSEWKHLIVDAESEVRKKFIDKIDEALENLTEISYTYGESIWETRLYNRYIREYLENVKIMNEYPNFSFYILDKRLE